VDENQYLGGICLELAESENMRNHQTNKQTWISYSIGFYAQFAFKAGSIPESASNPLQHCMARVFGFILTGCESTLRFPGGFMNRCPELKFLFIIYIYIGFNWETHSLNESKLGIFIYVCSIATFVY
jgi:hypothetical protein